MGTSTTTVVVRVRFTEPVDGPPDRFVPQRHRDDRHELRSTALALDDDEVRFLVDDEIVERWPRALVERIDWTAEAEVSTAGPSLDERRRQARAPRLGERWTPEENDQLRAEHAAGLGVREIAAAHRRNPGGISSQLVKLGLIVVAPPR